MSNHPSRSGPCSALWAAPTLLLTFILAACSGQPPTVADHLEPATNQLFNVCADRTGSGGEKGSQAVVPALADAIEAHVDPKVSEADPIPGLGLEIHFVDEQSSTEDERFSVLIPAVPGLKSLPPATGNNDVDIKAADTWTEASRQRTTALEEALMRAQTESEKVGKASQVPRASAVITCLASFGEEPVTGTVLISDAENNRAQPDGVKVAGPLLVIQLCVKSPEACGQDFASVAAWWKDHGGGDVSPMPANVRILATQIGDVFAAGAR